MLETDLIINIIFALCLFELIKDLVRFIACQIALLFVDKKLKALTKKIERLEQRRRFDNMERPREL